MGGTWSKTVSGANLLVTNKKEQEANGTKVKQATEAGLDIVDVQWVQDCIAQKKKLNCKRDPYLLKRNSLEGTNTDAASNKHVCTLVY